MTLGITIAGNTVHVILTTIKVTKQLAARASSATFTISNPSPAPQLLDEVIITNTGNSAIVFRGYVTDFTIDQKSGSLQFYNITCVGLEYLLDNMTINQTWTGQTDQAIIQSAFGSALPEITTTSSTVSTLAVALNFTAKDITLHQMLDNLAIISGADYYIDGNKALWWVASGSIGAPFGFSDTPTQSGGE